MNNLIETIEQFDPGHFSRRHVYLLKLSEKDKPLNITVEMIDDMEMFPDLLHALKEAARYED